MVTTVQLTAVYKPYEEMMSLGKQIRVATIPVTYFSNPIYCIRCLVHEKRPVTLVPNYKKPLNKSNGGISDRK